MRSLGSWTFSTLWKICAILALCLFATVFVSEFGSAERDFKAFQKDAKLAVDPYVLKIWANPIISTNVNGVEIRNVDLPWSVRRIGYPGNVEARVLQFNGSNRLYIVWGGGFESWGLIVCSNHADLHDEANTRIVPWIPGLYFFRSKR
jgi:hypothetical protein